MKLINHDKAFDMSFNSEDVHVPTGKFNCSVVGLAHHIIAIAKKWGLNVEIVDSTDLNALPKTAITQDPVIEPIEEKQTISPEVAEEIEEIRKTVEEEESKPKEEVKRGRPPKK
ncbi:MAG: hypothetical protein KJ906_02735 [Nanoarchaeota archaeon]|nr:hypothetical protein [Nanoarchaeota archaeon]